MSWIFISIFTAFIQTIRNASQKHLRQFLSNTTTVWVRFIFGFPFALLAFLGLLLAGYNFPQINNTFLINVSIACVAQIIGISFLVALFSRKNFAVGTAYIRTDAIQSAIIGMVFFHESISFIGMIAIIIAFIGLIFISVTKDHIGLKRIIFSISTPSALMGIISGTSFAISGLFVKNSTLSMPETPIIINASFTIVFLLFSQAIAVGLYLYITNKKELFKIKNHFKNGLVVGFTSLIVSTGWYTAYALSNVAYVKAVGQIEMIFSMLISKKFFKEKIETLEIVGIFLILSGILLLVFQAF